jgi:glycerol-3-phosphate dehydrogenase (NAD(P)+)
MKFGILGNGSWGTALAKILTDNNNSIHWWFRNDKTIQQLMKRGHNPHYLSTAHFDTQKLMPTTSAAEVIQQSDCIIIAVPSAYTTSVLATLDKTIFEGKKVVSAVKGILPDQNLLLNDYLNNEFYLPLENYFAVLGPCHAEEVAAEKLSYLTFSGVDTEACQLIARHFKTSYINIVENPDIYGVQFAAILKNIYALGAGIAHGLDYGDNFLSVLIANSADEMAGFLKKTGVPNIEVGSIEHKPQAHNTKADEKQLAFQQQNMRLKTTNYAASVYLGDLLVTCYSLYSRNRMFGNMIGKGYSVKSAQIEMSMVAEGYNASRCMYVINQSIQAEMPIAETVYKILWEGLSAEEGFAFIEKELQ